MKPVVLFNFGYNRKGWIAPIEALKDSITIVYLFYISRDQETTVFTSNRIVYWGDYSNVNELLDDVSPDKFVTMSLDSGLGILLNFAARKRGIRTYILQHGIYSNYRDYREREIRTKKLGLTPEAGPAPAKGFNTTAFFKRSLRFPDYFFFLKFPLFVVLTKRNGFRFASRWVRFGARVPDYYICYTPHNARIHQELDHVREDKFLYIGNPEMDPFFASSADAHAPSEKSQPYFLLIDQPLADNRYGEHICTREQMIAHYLRLRDYAVRQQAVLKVKLHPESYHSEWLPKLSGIEWVKDHDDLPSLVKDAAGCFGYFSTLLVPAIYFNRCVLFRVSDNEMQRDAVVSGLVRLLDFFTYSADDLHFEGIKKDQLNIFAKKYLLFQDGQSTSRLKDILLN